MNLRFAKYRPRPDDVVVEAAKIPEADGVEGIVVNGNVFPCGQYVVKFPDGSFNHIPADEFESDYQRVRAPRKKA